MKTTAANITKTTWGWIGLARSRKGICAIILPRPAKSDVIQTFRKKYRMTPDQWREIDDPLLNTAIKQIEEYLEGRRRRFDFPVDLSAGTAFRQSVWKAAKRIPFGKTVSYGHLARQVGNPRAARAIGGAMGANPVPLFIPCHRVLACDNSLGGFGGGLKLKRRLLDLEQAAYLNK